jgi:hypothetical protein
VFSDYLQKKESEATRAKAAVEALAKGSRKTVLFHWADAMGKDAEEAKKRASTKPGADGKWEGVTEMEKVACMKKVRDLLRS